MRYYKDKEALVFHVRDVDSCLRLTNSVLNIITILLKVTPSKDMWFLVINTLVLSLITLGKYLYRVREIVIIYKEPRTLELVILE
jgi:hypothetical protein